MGFNLFEIAGFLGRPVCLYELEWGATIWRYTSADRDVEWGEDDLGAPLLWTAIAISDNGFTQGANSQDFEVKLPRSLPVVQLFRSTPPAIKISLVCRRFHKDDTDAEAAIYWQGTVGNVKGKNAAEAMLFGLPISSTIKRSGLRLCWEVGCPHALYDTQCRVDRELFKVETTITAMTGASVTVASLGAYPGVQFQGGYLEWIASAEGTPDRRAIESYAGSNTFNLLGTTDRLEVGQALTLFIGCDLSTQMCDEVFNNLANHGGHEYLASKSPFDGDPVF